MVWYGMVNQTGWAHIDGANASECGAVAKPPCLSSSKPTLWKIHHTQIISNHVQRKQPWNSIAFQSYMFDYGYPLTLKHGWKRPGSFMFFSDAHGQLMSCQLDGPVETHCESKGTVLRSCCFSFGRGWVRNANIFSKDFVWLLSLGKPGVSPETDIIWILDTVPRNGQFSDPWGGGCGSRHTGINLSTSTSSIKSALADAATCCHLTQTVPCCHLTKPASCWLQLRAAGGASTWRCLPPLQRMEWAI